MSFGRLAAAAAAPYRAAGPFAWLFARGKLRRDPVFRHLLGAGLVTPGARVLDLGCGQGLLGALLAAAGTRAAYRGIERMPRDVARAHRALGAGCGVELGDVRDAGLGAADVVVMIDVLHYLERTEQDALLERVRAALAGGGVLIARVANSDAGARYRLGVWVDGAVARLRGHGALRFHARGVAQWRSALEQLGFAVHAEPMSRGTPFANVLLVARLPRHA